MHDCRFAMPLATSTVAPEMLLESQGPSLLLMPTLLSMSALRTFLLDVRRLPNLSI